MAHPGGRPTLYKPEYCEQLIHHMSQGLSFESFAGVLGVTRATVYNWAKENHEFLDAKNMGMEKCRLFYEKAGIAGMVGKIKDFNTGVWFANMRNRFNWTNKQEIEVSGHIDHEHSHEVLALVNELKDVIQLPNDSKRLPILEVLKGDGT